VARIYYDIGNLGAMLFNEACCQPPLDFFNTINNSYSSVEPMKAAGLPVFQIPLPTAYGSAPERLPIRTVWFPLSPAWLHREICPIRGISPQTISGT
jgi:hypothetical protein